jgi:hypothetical protein
MFRLTPSAIRGFSAPSLNSLAICSRAKFKWTHYLGLDKVACAETVQNSNNRQHTRPFCSAGFRFRGSTNEKHAWKHNIVGSTDCEIGSSECKPQPIDEGYLVSKFECRLPHRARTQPTSNLPLILQRRQIPCKAHTENGRRLRTARSLCMRPRACSQFRGGNARTVCPCLFRIQFVQGLRDAGMTVYKAAQIQESRQDSRRCGRHDDRVRELPDKYREKANLADRCKYRKGGHRRYRPNLVRLI